MDNPIFSEHWYRVKSLKPQMRAHIKLYRHEYREQVWYVLEDNSSTRFHRFNGTAYRVIGLMDGLRTVDEIWEDVNTQLGDEAPGQDEIIRLLGKLHHIDALRTDISADVEELLQRGEELRHQQVKKRFSNPLSIRVALFDPDHMLDRALPHVRGLYSMPFLLLWFGLVFAGVLLASSHWQALVATARVEALTPFNLLLFWLIYPFVKLLHELGHAFAAKLEGGEVHEMGIIFLVFIPIPYVDASAATAFVDKRKRVMVSAAGVMVELLLAVLALFLWLNIEAGMLSSICFNIMLIGGISTLLFNGNPLLRFDGYYVLADSIGIPNLAQRSNKYLGYLILRYVFGSEEARSPITAQGEAAWFVFYAIASFCYRMLIMTIICLFLIDNLSVVGVALASLAVLTQVILPLGKQLSFLVFDPMLNRTRARAVLATTLSVAILGGVIMKMPVSSLTKFEGVVWPPDESHLVAQTDGFVRELLAQPGAAVVTGQPLIQLQNEFHQSDLTIKTARLKELSARFRAARVYDRVQAKLIQDEISAMRAQIERSTQKIDSLLIVSPADGYFLLPEVKDLPGQFVRQGRVLGYVAAAQAATARVVVTQADLDRITQRVDSVELRLASEMYRVMGGALVREVPQASRRLPSKVLSIEGGGTFAPDPQGKSALATSERLFEFEITLPLTIEEAMIGTRVYVRFDHGDETLAKKWHRRFSQLFLRRLNV